MKRYNFELAQAFHKTDIGLDGIIRSLGGEPIPRHKETIVWYNDESISTYNIVGELGQNSIPNKVNAVKVEIGTAVTSIGDYLFYECYDLKSIIMSNSITSIGSSAFSGCVGLSAITISNNVESIGSEAFNSCEALTSITLPNSVTSIGSAAFSYCNTLTSITLPNSVTSIGYWAFGQCPATVTFEGKDKATVQGMTEFRWEIGTDKIVCTDGTL